MNFEEIVEQFQANIQPSQTISELCDASLSAMRKWVYLNYPYADEKVVEAVLLTYRKLLLSLMEDYSLYADSLLSESVLMNDGTLEICSNRAVKIGAVIGSTFAEMYRTRS